VRFQASAPASCSRSQSRMTAVVRNWLREQLARAEG